MNEKFSDHKLNLESAVEDLIGYIPEDGGQEDVDAVIKLLSKSSKEPDSTEDRYPLIEEVARQFNEGVFEFLNPENKENLHSIRFQKIMLEILKVQFGTENGVFLLERWQADKLSSKMSQRIDWLARYAMEQYIQEQLNEKNSSFDLLRQLFREAFHKGELPEIDRVIKETNKKIEASKVKLNSGSATVDDGTGKAEYIAIILAASGNDAQLAVEWCKL